MPSLQLVQIVFLAVDALFLRSGGPDGEIGDVIDYSSERLPVSVVEHNLVDGRETSFLIAVLPHLVCRSVRFGGLI